MTISERSMTFSSPSRKALTLGLMRTAILSRRRLAFHSWAVETITLKMMTPVAAMALVSSWKYRRAIPRMKRTTLKGVSRFLARISKYPLL